jgi:outer membrane immunogenic protein
VRIAVLAAGIATSATALSLPAWAEPASSFAGGYVGFNAGAAWGSSSYETNPNCPPTPFAVFCDSGAASAANGPPVAGSGTGDLSSTGFTGGLQGGYNWQLGNTVLGGEGDFGALNLSKSASSSGAFPVPFLGNAYSLNESMSTDWLATLRGRIGYMALPHLLLYGTGGLALTRLEFSSSYADNAIGFGFPGGTGFGSRSESKVGWLIGGGGEWMLDGHHVGWSIRMEYLYLDFGSMTVAVPASNTADFTQTMFVDADLSAQLVRAALNYHY